MERHLNKLRNMLPARSRHLVQGFIGMLLAMCAPAWCQSAPHFEISGSYSYVRARSSSGQSFDLHGGSVSGAYRVGKWTSIAGDVGGYSFTDLPNGVKGRLYTFLFGPRICFRPGARVTPIAQLLLGMARHTAETPTDKAGENSFALALGGGLDLNLNRHFAIRAVQADYLLTRFAGATGNSASQNNVRLSTGVVVRF